MSSLTASQQASDLREKARTHESEAHASFERCDTDGALSQWAHGISAEVARKEADLIEAGGVHEFPALFDLEGNYVPARLIDGRYGLCWMLLDAEGECSGFVSAFPKRRATMVGKGYLEGYVVRPARVVTAGKTLTSVHAKVIPSDSPLDAPIEVVTADRWQWQDK